MKKRALLSVFNKEGLLELASFLVRSGWELVSTGNTSRHLGENNIPVTDVSSVTGFPECLDGRVKTLHPAIHAGILARRSEASHMETLERFNLGTIDLVCVNLYPFFEKAREFPSLGKGPSDELIEFIDIGGPAMLRSAAKNHRDVIVISDPADYGEVMAGLEAGSLDLEFRRRLAGKVFNLTAAYDAAVASCFLEAEEAGGAAVPAEREYPAYWPLSLKKAQALRYGENSHQSAALYLNTSKSGALGGMEQLHGKELGYNNIRDLDLAWKAACAFGLPSARIPPVGEDEVRALVPGMKNGTASGSPVCCVAVKHNTPCGFALGRTLIEAYEKVFACDPVSIFGGIVAANTAMDAATAERLAELFLEIIIAPAYEIEALEILKKKKNLRILRAKLPPSDAKECIAVDGGLLVQETDRKLLNKWELVTREKPSDEDIPDLIFGMRAVSFVKSNAIMIVKDLSAAGIGGGQVNRIWPAMQALERSAALLKSSARVLASDGFIPFPDVVEAAAAAGIKAIIQPGGSVNDNLSIEACDKLGLAMVFTGLRHFKH